MPFFRRYVASFWPNPWSRSLPLPKKLYPPLCTIRIRWMRNQFFFFIYLQPKLCILFLNSELQGIAQFTTRINWSGKIKLRNLRFDRTFNSCGAMIKLNAVLHENVFLSPEKCISLSRPIPPNTKSLPPWSLVPNRKEIYTF